MKHAAEPGGLEPAVAVSPEDSSSDRKQSDADQVITVELLQALIRSSQQVIDVVQVSLRVRRWLIVLVAVLSVIMLAMLAVLIGIALQNRTINQANRDNGQQIRDCIPPPPGTVPGVCYLASQARTAEVVAQLAAQNAAALTAYRSCLRANPDLTDRQLQACVVGKLTPAPKPTPKATPGRAAPPARALPGRTPAPARPPATPTRPPAPQPTPTPSPAASTPPDPLICIPALDLCI